MGFGWVLRYIQELFGSSRRASDAAETGIFRFSPAYSLSKTLLCFGLGVLFFAASVSVKESRALSAAGVLLGLWLMVDGVRIARGLRRVVLADGTLSLERAYGERMIWPLEQLFVVDPGFWMSHGLGSIAVRERPSGRVVFSVPRDLPGWEVLVAQIPSVERS